MLHNAHNLEALLNNIHGQAIQTSDYTTGYFTTTHRWDKRRLSCLVFNFLPYCVLEEI